MLRISWDGQKGVLTISSLATWLWKIRETELGQTNTACKKSNLVWIFEQMLHYRQICRTVNASRIFKEQVLNIGQCLHEGTSKVPSQMPQQCWWGKHSSRLSFTIQHDFPHHSINRIGFLTVRNTACLVLPTRPGSWCPQHDYGNLKAQLSISQVCAYSL